MPTLIRKLPFFEHATTVSVPGGPVVNIKHHQIILWVSITKPGLEDLPPGAPRFPAVLDTGFNDNFLIQEQHIATWAGLSPQALSVIEFMSAYGRNIPLVIAEVWLPRNIRGQRDQFSSQPPFRLELKSGIGVCPVPMNVPRLPLLGLRALRRADLQLAIDCQRCHVSLRTPRRLWIFG